MSQSNINKSFGRLELADETGLGGIRGLESDVNQHAYVPLEQAGIDDRRHPESVDIAEPVSLAYKEHLTTRRKEPRGAIWFFVLGSAFLTSVYAILMVSVVHQVTHLRYFLLRMGLLSFSETTGALDSPKRDYVMGWVLWVVPSILFAISAALLEAFSSSKALGSGTADVMSLLNGIEAPAVFSRRTFFAKFLSTVFSAGCGLPMGFYGAVMLSGAQLSAALLGRARIWPFRFVRYFRNPRDVRIITIVGAAVGVSGAFAVPLGGLLFVMEVLSSAFPNRWAFYVFTSCLTCSFCIQAFFSYFQSFSLRSRDGLEMGELFPGATILFDTRWGNTVGAPMNFLTFIPSVLLGVLCGLLGALYIKLSAKIMKLRRRYAPELFKTLETSLYAILYASLTYWVAVGAFGTAVQVPQRYEAMGCHNVPTAFKHARGTTSVNLYGIQGDLCHANLSTTSAQDDVFHPFASLSFGMSDNAVQMLLSINTSGDLGVITCSVFFILYFAFCLVSHGARISGDNLLPSLVLGGAIGRVVGLLVHFAAVAAASGDASQVTWSDPGVCALIGAAAMLAGMTRLTFATVIIIVEITNDFRHASCVMVAVSIAKAVGDRFSKSSAATQLDLAEVPVLDFYDKIGKYDMFTAKDVMVKRVTACDTMETVGRLLNVLRRTCHNGFPVKSAEDGTVKGLILRSQLRLLLWRLWQCKDDPVARKRDVTYDDLQDVAEQLWRTNVKDDHLPEFTGKWLEYRVNLNRHIDTSCYVIHERTVLSRMYYMFQTLGLRHLVVTDAENKLTGIITRKDLLASYMMRKLIRANQRRLNGDADSDDDDIDDATLAVARGESRQDIHSKFFAKDKSLPAHSPKAWKVDADKLCGRSLETSPAGANASNRHQPQEVPPLPVQKRNSLSKQGPTSPLYSGAGKRRPMLMPSITTTAETSPVGSLNGDHATGMTRRPSALKGSSTSSPEGSTLSSRRNSERAVVILCPPPAGVSRPRPPDESTVEKQPPAAVVSGPDAPTAVAASKVADDELGLLTEGDAEEEEDDDGEEEEEDEGDEEEEEEVESDDGKAATAAGAQSKGRP